MIQRAIVKTVQLLGISLALGPLGCDEPGQSVWMHEELEADGAGTKVEWFQPGGNFTYLCPFRWSAADDDQERGLPYCATTDLEDPDLGQKDWASYERLVISQHGRGGDAENYFVGLTSAATSMADKGHIDGETFVIAPQFVTSADVAYQGLGDWQMQSLIWWKNSDDWPIAGLSSGSPGPRDYSSFALIEQLIAQALEKMPNVTEVILTGQSAGGQTVQRFALLNSFDFPENVQVRYLPANPYTYTYLTSERPTFEFAPLSYGFETPTLDEPYAWPDVEICSGLDGEAMPASYNDFEKGMVGLPAHYVGPWHPFQSALLASAYLNKDVTYLIGEADVTHEEQCFSTVQNQGRHRRERTRAYAAHVASLGGDHGVVEVPDRGHGGSLYSDDCVGRVIFGVSESCDAIGDHDGGMTWDGDITAVAYANIDGDSAREMAVLHEVDGETHVWLLDDANHGYAVLQDVTGDWPAGDRATDIAFGNLVGGYPEELVIGRASRTESAWVAYTVGLRLREWAAEGGDGRDAQRVAVGNLSGNSKAEVAVTWDSSSGERWAVYTNDGNDAFVHMAGGSWEGDARPVSIDAVNVNGMGTQELVVGTDAESGARLHVYDLLGNSVALGSDWPAGSQLVDVAGGAYGPGYSMELLVARTGPGWRWAILGDAGTGFAELETGGEDWPASVQPTAVAMGWPAPSLWSFAIARRGPVEEKVEVYTARADKGLGNLTRDGRYLGEDASVVAMMFADVDGRGGQELVFGRSGDPLPGYRFRVLAAP